MDTAGLTHSTSKKGCTPDNTGYERFFSRLSWSQVQLDTLELRPSELLVGAVLAEVRDIYAPLAAQKHQVLTTTTDCPTCHFRADSDVIQTILRNLVANAIKFTPPDGTVVVEGSVNHQDSSVAFSVTDSGIGIPPDQLEGIFKVTSSLRRPGTEGEQSSGLGLVLCREFVGLHRDSVRVQSTEGVGSTLTVTIPLDSSGTIE